MEVLAIASVIFFVKVILCCTLLRNCKTRDKNVKKNVNIGEKICKESTDSPSKPPRGVKKVKKGEKSDHSNLSKNITANDVQSEIFGNYIRSKVYKSYCNKCQMVSSEEEARFREESIQSEKHSKDALRVSIKSQEQKSSSEIGIDSSKSILPTSEVIKTIQFKVVTDSMESKNSQQLHSKNIINDETETTYMKMPTNKEILTSTKLRSKNSPFHKLRKYFVAGLHRIFRIKN
ncbi:uncharacterized protein LOC114941701 isoform X2 [Nylanderia fulva]|uniref:uncharacterized protein LOC114941701 isoform X2 n=1 Tax=Nylanderia fulva TaxID=613905 RepID=UPI0010FB6917|nr:uncharacterized protein LOC114941701 isoform X2 [Nylanderia fulva]